MVIPLLSPISLDSYRATHVRVFPRLHAVLLPGGLGIGIMGQREYSFNPQSFGARARAQWAPDGFSLSSEICLKNNRYHELG